MKVLVTGGSGFIGKNLTAELENNHIENIYVCDTSTSEESLRTFCRNCDFVFHLAGVNRPLDTSEFMEGNCDSLTKLLHYLKESGNTVPVMLSSSIQAEVDNPYGKSKLAAEHTLLHYARDTGTKVYIYRLTNVFGKWCRPNYNSVVATFCHNIAHRLPIHISNKSTKLNLVYIDDVIHEFLRLLTNHRDIDSGYYNLEGHTVTLGEIAGLLYSFQECREQLRIPNVMEGSFSKKLYSTYISYLPADEIITQLKINQDSRGSFTEMIKTDSRGQFSVNISKVGIEKGNHWHHTKCEKFIVVQGKALIQLRKVGCNEVISYSVSGENIQAVDIPPGYTHNIINTGDIDLITFMWCSECFDPDRPDTYYLKVNEVIPNE